MFTFYGGNADIIHWMFDTISANMCLGSESMNGVFSPCSDDSIHGPTLLRFPPIGTATPTHLDPFRPISTHFDPLRPTWTHCLPSLKMPAGKAGRRERRR